mmetsp:Transcript_59670/g.172859  ORF Transcript_59670/g.172859 Transcript_59670/m.172859 type:complete len:697 (-) Transcript_59670:401-2491(-)
MELLGVELLDESLQRGHEARGKVAILQEHPLAGFAAVLDAGDRLRALALAQADGVDVREHVERLRQLLDVGHRITTHGEDVNQRDGGARVAVTSLQVQRRRLEEESPELLFHHIHEGLHDTIRPQCEHQQGLLDRRALHLEVVRPLGLHRVVTVEDRLPSREVRGELPDEAVENVAERLQHVHTLPADICQPLAVRRLILLLRAGQPSDQGHDFWQLQLLLYLLAFEGEHDRVQELVLFEEAAADHHEQEGDEGSEELGEALVLVLLRLCQVNGFLEHKDEPVERELIHRVDDAEIADDEVQGGAAHGVVLIDLPDLCNLLPRDLLLLHLLLDLRPDLLGVAQSLDELLVVQDVAGGRAQERQNLVLEFLQLRLGLRGIDHQFHALLFGLRLLRGHHDAEHLILQTVQRSHEVQNPDGDADLRREVRVRQLGCHIQLEVLGPLDRRVAEAHHEQVALFECRFLEDGIQDGVEHLLDVFQQDGVAELDCVLQLADIAGHGQPDHLQLLAPGPLHPLVGLPLRVDHQRPAACGGDDDAVLHREVVVGQPIDGPLLDHHRLPEDVDEVGALFVRDLLGHLGLPPRRLEVPAVLAGEGPCVCDHAGGYERVPREEFVLLRKLVDGGRPTVLLPAEAVDELRRVSELDLAHLHLLGQLVLLRHSVVVISFELRQLVLDGLQLRLRRSQLRHCHLETCLGVG